MKTVGTLLMIFLGISIAGCQHAEKYSTPQEGIDGAWRYFSDGESDFAVDTFEAVLGEVSPGSDEQLAAWYGLGVVWSLRRPGQDEDRAREYFNKVIQTAPTHKLSSWSRLAMARMEYLANPAKEPDYKKVYDAYQKVVDADPKSIPGQEALLYCQAIRLMSLKQEDARIALQALQQYVQEFPGSLYESLGYSLMAEAYKILGDSENQLRAYCKYIETLKVDPKNPFFEKGGLYWTAATLAEFKAGDFDTARYYYQKLIDEYPNDVRVYVSRRALKRMDSVEAKLRNEPLKEDS